MRGRLIIEDFVHWDSLYMWASGFEVLLFQIIKHIYRSKVIWRTGYVPTCSVLIFFFAVYLSVAFHEYPIRGKRNQSKVVQVNCIRLQGFQSRTKGLIFCRASIPAHAFLHIYSMWVSNLSFSSNNTPKRLLEVTCETILLSMDKWKNQVSL